MPMRAKSIMARIKDNLCARMMIVLIKKIRNKRIPGRRMNGGIGR
jgi:hypothetical protein